MCRYHDVAGQCRDTRETAFKILDDLWMARKAVVGRAGGKQAVGINHIEAAVAFTGFPRPRCASGRMARCELCPQADRADVYGFPVNDRPDLSDRRNGRQSAELRIIVTRSTAF